MSAYLRLTNGEGYDGFYDEGECLGHLVGSLDALKALLVKEPTKHFLTREPLNSAEEYVQAVGWQLLKAV